MGVLIPEMPHRPNASMEYPSKILETDCGRKRFRFTFTLRDKLFMYITFPVGGGVRIRNSYPGMFEPSDVSDIIYTEVTEDYAIFGANGTTVKLLDMQEDWKIEVYSSNGDLKTVIDSGIARQWGVNIKDKFGSVKLYLPKREGEKFFGFGERFNNFYQTKSKLLMWNIDVLISPIGGPLQDEYCDKPQGYKNIPFFHSNRNYSIFFNTFLPIEFDIGETNPNYISADIYGRQLDMYIWTGTPKENLRHFQELTGKPFLPPKWAFDYWIGGPWGKWNTPDSSYNVERVRTVLDKYKELGITINQAYLETDPTKELYDLLKEREIHCLMWTNSVLPKYGKSDLTYSDYRVKTLSDPEKVMHYNYIDFTSPASIDAICEKFDEPWDLGLQGEMVDYADSMPEDAICFNGKTGLEMHNEYAYWYGRRLNEAFYERLGDDFVLFQRSGCAGSSHYTASFGGDIVSSFLGLRRSVYELLTASASGISIWGCDMGGFHYPSKEIKDATDYDELFKRWVQFSSFLPLMREHSGNLSHEPWDTTPEAAEVFKKYYTLRLGLLDKFFSSAAETTENGGTMIKPMPIAFGTYNEHQYLFCDDFLIRPIVEQGQYEAVVEIPEDGFTYLYDGKRYSKGEYNISAPVDTIPVFIRAGSVIPLRLKEDMLPSLDKKDTVSALMLTAPETERKSKIYFERNDKAELVSEKTEDGFKITADREMSYKNIILYGIEGAAVTPDNGRAEVKIDEKYNRTVVTLTENWNTLLITL